jgi:proteasome lid subunit RPN8/RPN11
MSSGPPPKPPKQSDDDGDIVFEGVAHDQQPVPGQRPDDNKQWAVVTCGSIDTTGPTVYVDLDVLRDMEAHARSDTSVELGGVLLGGQFLDDQRRPFVVVSDSLRAEHYAATRGSFTFTHETWAEITRQREQLPDHLQMVGWYHTHPNWGVFLSGMDQFICSHFFARPLDVALVIDPCRNETGWFVWRAGVAEPVRTKGFYLFAHRHRLAELEFFAAGYNWPVTPEHDPRFVSHGERIVQPIVNIHDQRTAWMPMAVLGMLGVQTLLVALLAVRTMFPASPPPVADQHPDGSRAFSAIREQAYVDLLNLGLQDASGQRVAERFAQLAEQNAKAESNLRGQIVLNERLDEQLNETKKLLDQSRLLADHQAAELEKASAEIQNLRTRTGDEPASLASLSWTTWLIIACGAVALLVIGAATGAALYNAAVRRQESSPDDESASSFGFSSTGDRPTRSSTHID